MSTTVRSLGAVPKIDHAESIAAGLEQMAADIRAGKLPFRPERSCLVLAARAAGADDVCLGYFGADTSTAELLGMLELAKLQALDDA